MKERQIIFNAEMVRAILDGRKTQTRRIVVNVQPDNCVALRKPTKTKGGTYTHVIDAPKHGLCPFGKVGDRLWVRETTEVDEETSDILCLSRYSADKAPVLYSGDPADPYTGSIAHWNYPRPVRPSIHMPRWASRIQLEITGARVERLNAISEDDAMAEGMDDGTSAAAIAVGWFEKPQRAFQRLWERLYGEDSWASNPWVWVIEFKRVEGSVA